MADGSIDVLMKVTGLAGPLAAESSTEFRSQRGSGDLLLGFSPGFFCELREFNFSAGVEASLDDNAKQDVSKLSLLEQQKLRDEKMRRQKEKEEARKGATPEKRLQDAVARMDKRQHNYGAKRMRGETVDMQPVEFTRVMDTMSVPLFKALAGCETLPALSVVKRKATGGKQSGEGYLRLDFKNVLITSLDWKDSEHLMLETGKFIYRELTISYRPQDHAGNLGSVVSADWKMKPARAAP